MEDAQYKSCRDCSHVLSLKDNTNIIRRYCDIDDRYICYRDYFNRSCNNWLSNKRTRGKHGKLL